jgi:hypothetical protein
MSGIPRKRGFEKLRFLGFELAEKPIFGEFVFRGYFRMPVVARYIVRDFPSQFSSLTENNAGRAASSHSRSCRASAIAGQFDKLSRVSGRAFR